MGCTGGGERMIPLQFALRRRMMVAGKDRQTWIYHNGKLLLPYTKFTNDARDGIVVTTTPNFKIQKEGYYDFAGIYFQVQINEKFVYTCIEKTNSNHIYVEVSRVLNTTEFTGQETYKGEHTISVNEPGLYYITFKINDWDDFVTFSELFVI